MSTETSERAPDWDGLADTLHEIIQAAIPLLRPTGWG
jgi:hypothetical protein